VRSLQLQRKVNIGLSSIFAFNITTKEISTTAVFKDRKASNLHKDIYKDIGYKSPFSNEENSLILKTINESKSVEKLSEFIAKTKAATLLDHMSTYGEFEIVEELLSVKKFDDSLVQRIGKKIIKLHEKENLSEETSSKTKAVKYKISKYIKPRISKDTYENIESFVAIKLSFYNISYTHFESKTQKVLDWNCLDCFESKASSEHPRLFETATEAVSQIPQADLYVLEEQLPILQTKQQTNLKSHVSILELQSAMVSLLNLRNFGLSLLHQEKEDKDKVKNCVHLMKFNVIDDMFQLKIGTERIGLQARLFQGEDSIFENHEAFNEVTFLKDYDTVLDEYYRTKLYSKFAKEHLGLTLLMAAAFNSSVIEHSSTKTL